ncbi:MAG: DUF1122 family protein [Candidatus Brocadiales bacterium]
MERKEPEKIHPIATLDGVKVNDYILHVTNLQQTKMSGWKFFAVGLSTTMLTQADMRTKRIRRCTTREKRSLVSRLPVIEGIYSRGGKGIAPWMEILTYHGRIEFINQSETQLTVDLSATGLDRKLFEQLGKLIPPGGHIMIWYENKKDEETYLALRKGMLPVVTELGIMLFWAGCRSVKDFSLPEGGLEGCRKLWGEKPIHERHKHLLQKEMVKQLRNFLAGDWRFDEPCLESNMKMRASKILLELKA